MIRILVQELENRRDHIQSMQFEMREELYDSLGELAFLAVANAMRKIPLLLESNHRGGVNEKEVLT